MTDAVNGRSVVLPTLFEVALRSLREGLLELSATRFPGLRTRHYRLLGFIPDGGIRPARMVELSGLSKQALFQALAPLEAGRYVVVAPDPDDRRARVVRLSDRGHEVIAALLEMQARYEREWAAEVGAERWAATRDVLVQLFAD
ncbi:MarR family winged helix-turn-helix transcriptional regulator [Modestobacter sp. URMC 112]